MRGASVAIVDTKLIKEIVRSNFDRSVALYDGFEDRYGLFSELTERLARDCGLCPGMAVIDVGCGSGISSFVLAKEVGPTGKILGIDFSEEMLEAARYKKGIMKKVRGNKNDPLIQTMKKKESNKDDPLIQTMKEKESNKDDPLIEIVKGKMSNKDVPQIEFIRGDAENLEKAVGGRGIFDGVQYNATIFLVPDPKRSLQGAFAILKNGGIVGLNYLKGLYVSTKNGDKKGFRKIEEIAGTPKDGGVMEPLDNQEEIELQNISAYAREKGLGSAPYGKRITNVEQLKKMMIEIGFRDVRGGEHTIRMSRQEVWDFYTIPAQSAGLYPKTPYPQRLELLRDLLDHFEKDGVSEYLQLWGWDAGIKR